MAPATWSSLFFVSCVCSDGKVYKSLEGIGICKGIYGSADAGLGGAKVITATLLHFPSGKVAQCYDNLHLWGERG